MAVPRKRKKLAETATRPRAKTPAPKKRPQSSRAKKTVKQNPSTAEQIDTAFAIMDSIDEEKFDPKSAMPEKTASKRKTITMDRLGFRFHFSVDAVMPESEDSSDSEDFPENKSSLLDIGLTIPFFWKMPIIGGIAQKVVRNFKTLKI